MSDDETRNGQSEFDPAADSTKSAGADESASDNVDANAREEDIEPQFDVAGAALGALPSDEEAELYAAAARDQTVSAELAAMEAVASELARLAPVQIMNRGRSAGIRSRLVARAAGTHVGRPASHAPPLPMETPRQVPRHQVRPDVGRPAAPASARPTTPAPAASGSPAGRQSNSARLVPFEPASRAGLERIVGALAVAAVIVIAAFGLYNWKTRSAAGTVETAASRDSALEAQLASLTATVRQRDSLIAALTGTHTRVIDLIGYNSVDPMARVFWDQKTQMFIMYASHVKQPPSGKTYQVWLITRGVASPVSVGTFMPDSAGSAIMATKHPMEPGTLRRIAVTEEPMGGMPTPTGPIMFTGVGR
jgi:anti-sigma-K factor RskA